MLKLGEIRNARGATKNRKRLGRGSGSGQGQTAGKGSKGQLQRTGGKVRPAFEGGQMPHFRRMPKRGFFNNFAVDIAVVNLSDISGKNLTEVSMESLRKSGLVRGAVKRVKVLGTGELKKALNLKVHAVSKSAKEKIEKAGGSIELLK